MVTTKDSSPGIMALVFGVSPYHENYKKGVLGKFRSSPAGKSFNAVFLIMSYILMLICPCVAIYQLAKAGSGAGSEAADPGVECKLSFPLRCTPADSCKLAGFKCVQL